MAITTPCDPKEELIKTLAEQVLWGCENNRFICKYDVDIDIAIYAYSHIHTHAHTHIYIYIYVCIYIYTDTSTHPTKSFSLGVPFRLVFIFGYYQGLAEAEHVWQRIFC